MAFAKLCAADYGVPQVRKRVFIVGFRNDLQVRWDFPGATHSREALVNSQRQGGTYSGGEIIGVRRLPKSSKDKAWIMVQDAIKDLPDPKTESARVMQHVLIPGARSYKGHTGSLLNWPAKSLKAGTHGVGGGENMLRCDNGDVRYFTVRECARLQTFPDFWVFKGAWSSITRQLGNAAPVKMAATVAKSLKDTLMRPPR
jgi:DNA (cytosine-5)-methyltransferase 1